MSEIEKQAMNIEEYEKLIKLRNGEAINIETDIGVDKAMELMGCTETFKYNGIECYVIGWMHNLMEDKIFIDIQRKDIVDKAHKIKPPSD